MLRSPVAGYPDSNLTSLITVGHIDLDFVHFISIRDPDLMSTNGRNLGPASWIGGGPLARLDNDDLIVSGFDEDALQLPLVVAGLYEDLLGAGLMVSGNPSAVRGVVIKNGSQIDTQGQAGISVTVPALSSSGAGSGSRASLSGLSRRR